MGYTRVRDFDGGMAEWEGAGLPVESGEIVRLARPAARPDPVAKRRSLADFLAVWVARNTIGHLLGTWLWINLGFGVLYWLVAFVPGQGLRDLEGPVGHGLAALGESVYFSFVTGLSIGFGDVTPVGVVRALAIVEGAACLLVFGCIISKLVSGRQEELTEEIHRIAFEDRLGRVRTNLHLVVAEIQDLVADCGAERLDSDAVVTRFESAAAVFAGELRAVHDLLYRPQAALEEDVLESILAHLDGGLREFATLLACLPPGRRASPALGTNTRAIAGLANEICGECVPREYAPSLKAWMDRIQDRARALAA
jgi:hypothetical protein